MIKVNIPDIVEVRPQYHGEFLDIETFDPKFIILPWEKGRHREHERLDWEWDIAGEIAAELHSLRFFSKNEDFLQQEREYRAYMHELDKQNKEWERIKEEARIRQHEWSQLQAAAQFEKEERERLERERPQPVPIPEPKQGFVMPKLNFTSIAIGLLFLLSMIAMAGSIYANWSTTKYKEQIINLERANQALKVDKETLVSTAEGKQNEIETIIEMNQIIVEEIVRNRQEVEELRKQIASVKRALPPPVKNQASLSKKEVDDRMRVRVYAMWEAMCAVQPNHARCPEMMKKKEMLYPGGLKLAKSRL